MEDFLNNLIASGPSGIFTAAVVYIIIYIQRNSTKKTRDEDTEKLKTELAVLKDKVRRFDELDLDARLASIEVNIEYIKKMLENRK